MNYTEFVRAVEEAMSQRLKDTANISVYTAVKNNGRKRTGIVAETPGINISPAIYLEEYYECYLEGKPLSLITEEILELYESIRKEESWDYEMIRSYEGVKDRVVFKVINTEQNRELLNQIPHIEMLDLSIVFYILLEISSEGTAAMLVSGSHAELWGIDVQTLWGAASENAKRLLPAEFFTMSYAMNELLSGENGDGRKNENLLVSGAGKEDGMYVLSNNIRNYGAACIAYPYILKMIGEILKTDYYVLPSSVHEVVIVPYSEEIDSGELDCIVREINETQVAEEEVLSDHAYLFSRRTGKLCAGCGAGR